MAIAKALNRITILNNEEYYQNPYRISNKRGRPTSKKIDLPLIS
jgi:hypothetical protein